MYHHHHKMNEKMNKISHLNLHHPSHDMIASFLQSSRDDNDKNNNNSKNNNYNNNLDDLILDTSSLDDAEQKRLKYLQQINADASNILRSSGINYLNQESINDDDNDNMFDKPIEDTQWTGQSTSERRMISTRDFRDIVQRPFLAFCDFISLLLFAIIGNN